MIRKQQYLIRAFTLVESLIVLFCTVTIIQLTSFHIQGLFRQMEEKIFWLSFESLYRSTQLSAITCQESRQLRLTEDRITNGKKELIFPRTIHCEGNQVIEFDRYGGNSSLSQIVFKTETQEVRYQIYLGNGKIKKK